MSEEKRLMTFSSLARGLVAVNEPANLITSISLVSQVVDIAKKNEVASVNI